MSTPPPSDDELLRSVQRPDKRLLVKYFIPTLIVLALFVAAAVAVVWFRVSWRRLSDFWWVVFFAFTPVGLFIRYYTLRYEVEEQGIRMSVGLINRKESYLTFARVQDIHLDMDLLDRWLGIGRVSIQTASGQSSAEVQLIGIAHPKAVRDALYRRLRRVQGLIEGEADEGDSAPESAASATTLTGVAAVPGELAGGGAAAASAAGADEMTRLLTAILEETGRLNASLAELRDTMRGGS